MPSDINSGYLKLNENLDIKVSMPHGEMVPVQLVVSGGQCIAELWHSTRI